jgi:Asp/Glu/hydantoin racemase
MERAPALIEPFIVAGKDLLKEGVKTIITSCGFLAMFHREFSQALSVPVFTSSLIQIPLVYHATGCRRVGVLTANSEAEALTERHFESVGASGIPVAIEGLQKTYFGGVLLNDRPELDVEAAERDVVEAARLLASKNRDIGAIVLECTNFPPFAQSIQRNTGLPVFDIITLTNMAYSTVTRQAYSGIM